MNNNCISDKNIEFENSPDKYQFKRNLNLEILRKDFNKYDNGIYSYVLTTVTNENGNFKQWGCAPNFQGKYVTLTTCKHCMRSYKTPDEWSNMWIAGFGDLNIESKKNFLFYLMRIKIAFISFKELWEFLNDDKETQKIKNSRYNPFGDIFEPKKEFSLNDELKMTENNFNFYHEPIDGHKHKDRNESWKKDIYSICKVTNRRPALLVGDENNTFYWSKPMIYFKEKLPRNCILDKNIKDFVTKLREK